MKHWTHRVTLLLTAVGALVVCFAVCRDRGEHAAPGGGRDTLLPAPAQELALEGVLAPAQLEESVTSSPAVPGIRMGHDTLGGVVVDPTGRPIAGASVFLRSRSEDDSDVDHPRLWSTVSDAEGRWRIPAAWSARSLLGAWAAGFERAYVQDLTTDREMRVVLEPSPSAVITVLAPQPERLRGPLVEQVTVRVRLFGTGAVEHPRPHEQHAVEWQQAVLTGVPVKLGVPRGVRAHVTAHVREFACQPAFAALHETGRDVVLRLVPSATIVVQLLDADTRDPLPLDMDGWGHVAVRSVESGFDVPSTSDEAGALRFHEGVAAGVYDLDVRYRGRVPVLLPRGATVGRSADSVRIDVALARDMERAVVHFLTRHAPGSPKESTPLAPGRVLLRRREDPVPTWRQETGALVSGTRSTMEALIPGTYDVLLWNGGRFPAVGALAGIVVRGGTETQHEVLLRPGWGYRPTDVLDGAYDGVRRMRAHCDELGVLPWVDNFEGEHFHASDRDGFALVPIAGYIGPYPFSSLWITEHPAGAAPREHSLRPSIGPPR
jgi:hypothetical protein